MIDRRIHDASLPMYAAWSLESPIYTAAVFLQIAGNEIRVVYSRWWKLKPLHVCIEDVVALLAEKAWRVRTHITPPDRDDVFAEQFNDQGLAVEAAPSIHDSVILTRRLFATLRVDPDANEDLIEAINHYSPREEPRGFVITDGHTLERYFVRALEIFAAWHHAGGGALGDEWGPAPDYTQQDRARI